MVSLDLKQPILHLNYKCVPIFLFKNGAGSLCHFGTIPPALHLTIYCEHFPILKSPQKLNHNLYRSTIPYPQIQNALKTESCFESLVPTHLMTKLT